MKKGVGRVFVYQYKMYISNCMALHSKGHLQHLLHNLIADISTFGNVSGMIDHYTQS